ncbi:hypothetical protein RQ831_22320 [Roseomonas gilardii]|uniref:Uncharacterized protein n=1 Tax=Roseomonas gilardii TaxID=257708 RepID=A0ABU3MM61_9PROT|nr:hypothetical protein [Roseomonas gilardii]MDT8333795.1 hypothetical protein [Roseomonas gilardii]
MDGEQMMTGAKGRNRERCWIVLGTDGRHVTLGRHSDPAEEEIRAAEQALSAQGQAGWLAVLEGDYWRRRTKMSVLAVRPLADPDSGFDEAVAAFEACRTRALQPA